MDLRRQQRFPVQFQSVLSGQPRGESVGTIMNLSKGGCRVETDSQVYSGMHVSLRLDVPGEMSPIIFDRAAVRWNRGREVDVRTVDSVSRKESERDEQTVVFIRIFGAEILTFGSVRSAAPCAT